MSEGNGIELEKVPGGGKVKISGREYLTLAILALALGGVVYVQDKRMENMERGHAEIVNAQNAMRREMAFQTWIQSIPADQRPKLVMPEGFAERIMGYGTNGH